MHTSMEGIYATIAELLHITQNLLERREACAAGLLLPVLHTGQENGSMRRKKATSTAIVVVVVIVCSACNI